MNDRTRSVGQILDPRFARPDRGAPTLADAPCRRGESTPAPRPCCGPCPAGRDAQRTDPRGVPERFGRDALSPVTAALDADEPAGAGRTLP